MSDTQLKQPNLSVKGTPGLCLVFVRQVFGVGAKYATAALGWANAQYKHSGTPPSDLAVPIWFHWNTSGHVAVWDKGTIYSTTAQGDKTFPSIQALMDYIKEGISYLGWSEDVDGVRVAEISTAPPAHNETLKPVTWNVRSEPSTSGAVLGIVHGGDTYATTVVAGDWRLINYGGHTGYVSPLAWSN